MSPRLCPWEEGFDLLLFVAQCSGFIGIWSHFWPPVWR